MASVSSLDKDLRKLRFDKYTPAAANEARKWIEDVLGDRLPPGDLLEGLKDGVALCRYVELGSRGWTPSCWINLARVSMLTRAHVDWLTSLYPAQSSSSSRPCPLFRWRTFPISSAHANNPP